jgi:hypothetical protein
MIAMSLAKRGDFEKASEQIAAFPNLENLSHVAIRCYLLVAEKQLERKDLIGARQTVRRIWPYIMMMFQMYQQAYALIQTIESTADRAVPLAKLAESMAKSMGP